MPDNTAYCLNVQQQCNGLQVNNLLNVLLYKLGHFTDPSVNRNAVQVKNLANWLCAIPLTFYSTQCAAEYCHVTPSVLSCKAFSIVM